MNINLKILKLGYAKGIFWIRLFGYGFGGKDTRIHRPLFSERNGFTKCIRIGNWSFYRLRYHIWWHK